MSDYAIHTLDIGENTLFFDTVRRIRPRATLPSYFFFLETDAVNNSSFYWRDNHSIRGVFFAGFKHKTRYDDVIKISTL